VKIVQDFPGWILPFSTIRTAAYTTAAVLDHFLKSQVKSVPRSRLVATPNLGARLQSRLDSLALGVILLSPEGRVVTMNHAAKQLLAEDGNQHAGPDGLLAELETESTRLGQLVAEATHRSAGPELGSSGVLTVSRWNDSPLHLLVSPVRGFDLDERNRVGAIVFAGDPSKGGRPTNDTLRTLFGLTPAECRLAMLLSDGHSITAITEMIGVSRNTVKSQLSSIYGKTGTSRQAQLVWLLLQMPATRQGSKG